MIKKKTLKKLPVEFQKLKQIKIEESNNKIKLISVDLFQTDNIFKEGFYRPISKYIKRKNE